MTDTATGDGRVTADLRATRTFITSVARVEDVHPHLRRITVAGGDLASFAPVGPDSFLYVLAPPPGRDDLTIDASFTWDRYRTMADDERPVGAYYTVRRWDPVRCELEMLFVLHGDEGQASAWATRRVAPGAPVALWGPRTAWAPPAATDWYLLVADETGLPAVAVILETLPPGALVRVVAEVANAAEQQPLPERDGVEITWLHRGDAPAGTATLLADAVRTMTWPAGTPYVWGGGESRALAAIRKHVRHKRGLPQDAVSLVAYWRHAAHADDED